MIEMKRSLAGIDHQEAYDVIYASEGIHQGDSFYKWILGLIKPVPGRTFLDISCGEGQLVYWAAESGLNAFGVDISHEAIEKARLRSPKANLQVGDGEALPYPDNAFDYVTNIGSLEHYERMDCGAREIARVMKPEAQAFVLLPNIYGFFWQIRAVWRTGDLSDDGQPIQRYGTINYWRRLLEANGLKVTRVYKYDYESPRTFADFLALLKRPKRMVYLALSPLVPLNLTNNFVFACVKES